MRLGVDEEGQLLLLDDRQRAQHVYILGKSGVGKTMLLALIVLQDLLRGAPVVFLDLIGTAVPYLRECLAAINLKGLAAERGAYPALNQRLRQEREGFFRRIRIVDLDTPDPRDRFNPLESVPGITTAELAEAFAAAIERMLGGKLSEMRALHLNLVSLASVVIDTGGGTIEDIVELCCMGTDSFRQYIKRITRKRAEGQLRAPVRPDLIMRYLSEFFALTSGRERRDLCASTLRALAIILSDPVAKRFLSSPTGNVDPNAVLSGRQSLLVNAPPHNLHTQTVISSLLLGRLSALAMRRSSQDVIAGRVPQVHVIVDEFQRCFSEEMAADLAVLRNKGLSMILAHQSSNQPPFHTPEGQAMLNSLLDNASMKMLMRMGQKDARDRVGECYAPDGNLAKRQTQEVTHTAGESTGSTLSHGQGVGTTTTEAQGRNRSQTQSASEAKGHSTAQAKGTQTTQTEGHSQSQMEGESEGHSKTKTTGQTQGSSLTRTEGHSESQAETIGAGESHGSGTGQSASQQQSTGEALGRRPDGGLQRQQSASQGQSLGNSKNQSESHSNNWSKNHSKSKMQSMARGGSLSKSDSEAHGQTSTRNSSRSKGTSQSHSTGQSQTQTQAESQTQTQGQSHGESWSMNHSEGTSQTQTTTEGHSQSHNHGTSTREVTEYYSVMEEEIVRSYELQNLPNRSVIVLRQGSGASTTTRMRTLDMPQNLVTRVGPLDGLRDLDQLIAPPPAEPEPTLGIADRLRAEQQFRIEEEQD